MKSNPSPSVAPSGLSGATLPASPVDSVGVPAFRVIEEFTKLHTESVDHDGEPYGVIQGPEFALDVFAPSGMSIEAFKVTLSAFAGNAASHAAKDAKIKALTDALEGLLEDTGIKDAIWLVEHKPGDEVDDEDARTIQSVESARAALALPCA